MLSLIIALMALVGAVAAIIYQFQVAGPLRERLDEQEAMIARLTGIDNARVTNTLDPRYSDADADLVADVPKDAAKLLDPPVLKFSYVATDSTSFKKPFAELTAALSQATGKPVEYVDYDSTDDQLRALHDGQLQITALNTGAVPIGVCAAGFVPLAQMSDDSGTGGYNMEIIVPAGSPLQKLQDLRDHELAVTEPTSNSGYKAPLVALREIGLRPPRDYRLRYSYGHINSIAGIKSKTFDAAAVAGDVLKREVAAGHIAVTDFRSIYRSEQTFPTATLGYVYNLKPELAAKVRQVILNFKWQGTGLEKEFGSEGKSKFIGVDYRKDWEFVRRNDESIGYSYQLKTVGTIALESPATQPAAAAP